MRNPGLRIWLSLAPALGAIIVLLGLSFVFGIAQSLGYISVIDDRQLSLSAYANLFSGEGAAGREFWGSLAFSLWISLASTLLSAAGALAAAIWLNRLPSRSATFALNWNLAFPHLVWAVFLLLILGQSGLLARWAAALGWIETPAQFPVVIRDSFGFGIILHYVTKEIPFLTLIVLAVLRTQTEGYLRVAENLGAGAWQRFRMVTLPLVFPSLLSGSLLVFAFVFSAYEVPALLGTRYPRTLPVLALDFFTNPDLRSRAEGMAISVIIALVVMLVAILARQREGRRA